MAGAAAAGATASSPRRVPRPRAYQPVKGCSRWHFTRALARRSAGWRRARRLVNAALAGGAGASSSLRAMVVVKLPAAHPPLSAPPRRAAGLRRHGRRDAARAACAIVVDDAPHVPALAPLGAAAPPMSVLRERRHARHRPPLRRARAPRHLPLADVVLGVRALHGEADADELKAARRRSAAQHVGVGAPPGAAGGARRRGAEDAAGAKGKGAVAAPARVLRPAPRVAALEARCGAAFAARRTTTMCCSGEGDGAAGDVRLPGTACAR